MRNSEPFSEFGFSKVRCITRPNDLHLHGELCLYVDTVADAHAVVCGS